MKSYARESVELVPLTVTVKVAGVETPTTVYKTALVADGTRPSVWTDAVTVDDDTGVMLAGSATQSKMRIFVKVADAPETPVVDVGVIALT